MKKLISILLVVCMCLLVGVMLTACGGEGEQTSGESNEHEHTYKTEWSKDKTHHWHACEGEACAEVSDKTEHTWNDGEITTEATADADGVKIYTCTACGQTKTETLEYTARTTVTKEEWEAAIRETSKGLFRYSLTIGDMSGSVIYAETAIQSVNPIGEAEYYVEKDGRVYYYIYDDEASSWVESSLSESWEETVSDEVDFVIGDAGFYVLKFDYFQFDEETQTYKCAKIDDFDDSIDYIANASFRFSDGKIVKVSWEFADMDNDGLIWYNTISYAEEDLVFTLPDFD